MNRNRMSLTSRPRKTNREPTPNREPRPATRDSIREIIDILDDSAFLPPDVVSLIGWVSDYYACGAGEAMAAAMPPRAWIESERHARITDAGRARLLTERGARRQILDALDADKPVRVESIVGKAG